MTVKVSRGLRTDSETTTVKVFADEYNIAPLTATMPVTLFSLNLKEITEDYQIPTFVWFKRSDVWNYNNLPENVYTMPIATGEQIRGNTNQREIYEETSAWIKELYEINPESHFNLYYNDYYAYGWLDATIANGIPAENYDVTLLSDGSASLVYFNENFTADDEQYTARYNEMLADYTALKAQVAEKGYYKEDDSSFVIDAGEIREYAYVMAKEEKNVYWWLTATRNAIYDIDNVPEGETQKKTDVTALEGTGKIVSKSLSTSFNGMDEDQKAVVKNLFNFDDSYFAQAESEGKQAMIILGTWQTYEYNFESYVDATMAYYGNEDYVYYYKGHPRNPTQTVDGKMEYLNELGLTDVDSTIPAELFFFYFPDLLVCTGYDSSTYGSLNDAQSGALWNITKSSLESSGKAYKDNIDACFSIASSENDQYGSFVNSENETVLIEETKSTDIYLYDTVTETLLHLVYTDGVYQEAV